MDKDELKDKSKKDLEGKWYSLLSIFVVYFIFSLIAA